jgi:tRNA(adenine34) deaminase
MDLALELARANLDPRACVPEVPVGALVADESGRILGRGGNAVERLNDPSAHAEILALRAAGNALGSCRLSGCVMVTTLEPCLMCVGALRHARIDGLVYGAVDVRAGAVVSCLHGLDMAGAAAIWHMGGVRGEACAGLLREFFAARRSGRACGQT